MPNCCQFVKEKGDLENSCLGLGNPYWRRLPTSRQWLYTSPLCLLLIQFMFTFHKCVMTTLLILCSLIYCMVYTRMHMLCFSFVVFVWSPLEVFIHNRIARIELGGKEIEIDIKKRLHRTEVGNLFSLMSFWFKIGEFCMYLFQLLLDRFIGLEGSLLSIKGIS